MKFSILALWLFAGLFVASCQDNTAIRPRYSKTIMELVDDLVVGCKAPGSKGKSLTNLVNDILVGCRP